MAHEQRKHPDLILLKVTKSAGFGFAYLSEKEFLTAVDHFMVPAAKFAEIDTDKHEQRRKVAYDVLWRFFTKPHSKEFYRESVRCIAASAVREKFLGDNPRGIMPRVVMIGRKPSAGGIVIRAADEYLEHPGFPMAVIVGQPASGGGQAHFFSSRKSYERTGTAAPSQDVWLPQIVFRLYAETPSVVMGMPRKSSGGDMAVECRALAFGRPARLVERVA